MIKNVNDFIKNINNQDDISLTYNTYIFKSPLIIGNTFKISGNESTLIGSVLICTDIIISDITFSNVENIIKITSDCSVTFKNCTFLGNNKNTAIILEECSNSLISLENCMFSNFFSAISINQDNTLFSLQNCLFQFCNISIDNVVKNSNIKIYSIINNLVFNSKESIFLKFTESFIIEDYYNFCFELCSKNNFARILGNVNNTVFDTSCFYIDNLKNLNSIISNCPHCATVFLREGNYNLSNEIINTEILINTPINLIGINSPILYKSQIDSIKYGITLNTSNVRIENIVIDGGENYNLRDGIHFEEFGGLNIKIKNVNISRVSRRGISIWGENTNNCIIKDCDFSYIKEQCAIYISNNVSISNCTFNNLKTAINCADNSKVNFYNNLFKNIYCCLLNDNPSFNNIKQKNNTFKFVENLFMLS